MKDGLRIALAVAVGYYMGRKRKVRLALSLAAAGASGRLGKNPAALVKRGSKLLGASPEVKNLTETVRGRLVEAGKAAAVTAASSQIDALSDRIQQRTDALLRPRPPARAREDVEVEYEEREVCEEEEEYEEERPRRRRAPAGDRPREDRRARAEEEPEEEVAGRSRVVRRRAPRADEPEDELGEELEPPRHTDRPAGRGRPVVRRPRR